MLEVVHKDKKEISSKAIYAINYSYVMMTIL